MTFPSGGPGYPQQGGAPYQPAPGTGSFPQSPQPPQPSATKPPDFGLIAALSVTGLGLVNYFLSFSSDAAPFNDVVSYLLVGGLLAAVTLLPKAPKTLPFAAIFSLLGGLVALSTIVRASGSIPTIVIVILILGILQMAVAVGAVLLEFGVLKPPAPKPAVPQNPYGQQFGQAGQQQPQYGQQHQFGQQPQQQPPATGGQADPFAQPTQFNPPSAGPGVQSTTYAPQQGQFFQQPSSEAGQQPPSTGTPPGGFGQQS
jgi:Family of unknown function (DUF5336)